MSRLLADCDLSRDRDRMIVAVMRYLPGPFHVQRQASAAIPYPCLYAPKAHLFIASSRYQPREALQEVEAIVRCSKADGLLVTPTDEEHGIRFDIVTHNEGRIGRFAGYVLHLGCDSEPTLVPRTNDDCAFRIGRSGLVPTCAMPWQTCAERLMGIARAAAELSAAVWGRQLSDDPVQF